MGEVGVFIHQRLFPVVQELNLLCQICCLLCLPLTVFYRSSNRLFESTFTGQVDDIGLFKCQITQHRRSRNLEPQGDLDPPTHCRRAVALF